MADSDLGGRMRWCVAVVIVAIGVVTASLVYATIAVNSGTPLTDDEIYSDEYGPDVTVFPGYDIGDAPTSGYPVHPYSILHLWVNATGPVSVTVSDPAGYIIQEGDAPVNLSYFAVMGGYYEVTWMPKSYNVTVTLTVIIERLALPASQSELSSLRSGLMLSLTLITVANIIAILSIVILLVSIDRRMKGV